MILKFTEIEFTQAAKKTLITEYIDQAKYRKVCKILDSSFEDDFQYTVIKHNHNRSKNTNLLKRLNQEVSFRINTHLFKQLSIS